MPWRWVAPLLLAAGLALPAAAQQRESEQRARQTLEERDRALAAAAPAAGLTAACERPVAFAEVLKAPDDPMLNFCYAQGQIAAGRVESAAATLERLLITNPDLHQIRVLYAVVLMRLDNLDEAESELNAALAAPGLDAELRREAERFRDDIAKRRRRLTGSASLSAGWHWDDNRAAYPKSKQFLFLDAIAEGTSRRNPETAFLAVGSAEVVWDPDFQRGHRLFARATGLFDDQTETDELDTEAWLVEPGGTFRSPWVDATLTGLASRIGLDDDRYSGSLGGKLRLDRRLPWNTDAFAEYEAAYDKHYNTETNTTAEGRDGPRTRWALGAGWNLMPGMRLAARWDWTEKYARDLSKFEAYRKGDLAIDHSWVFWRSLFLITGFKWGSQIYDSPDLFVSTRQRTDWIIGGRMTLGAPLSLLPGAEALPRLLRDGLEDLVLTLTADYQQNNSTLTNFEYNNWKAQALLTKRFAF